MRNSSMTEVLKLLFKTKRLEKRFENEEYKLKGNSKSIYTYIINSKMNPDDIPIWMVEDISKYPTIALLVAARTGSRDDKFLNSIGSRATTAYIFAEKALKGRFLQGEEILMKSPEYRKKYRDLLISLNSEK